MGIPKTRTSPKRMTYSAPALEKGLDVLELLAGSQDTLSMSEIAVRLKRSMGEIFRMVAVLEQRGFVAPSPGSDKYQLTMKMFRLANMHPPIDVLVSAAQFPMRRLAQTSGQSCHLAILDDASMRIIARQESFADISFNVRVGTLEPVFESCSGNILYAFSDERLQLAMRERAGEETEAAPDLEALAKCAAKIVRRGSHEMTSCATPGIRDIGYPVFDHEGAIAAALVIPYLGRVGADREADRALTHSELSSAATEISQALQPR